MAKVSKDMSNENRIPDNIDRNYAWPLNFLVHYKGCIPALHNAYEYFETEQLAESSVSAKRRPSDYLVSILTWKNRELARTGEKPIFSREPWYIESIAGEYHFHCALMSREDRGNIRYYPTIEKAMRGQLTSIKVGRYLKKYFPDQVSEKQIEFYARCENLNISNPAYLNPDYYALLFAHTREEIAHVYESGPKSCMSYPKSRYGTDGIHPAEIYAAGDLAIAYLSNVVTGKIVARALTWPEKHVYGRVYPNVSDYESDGFQNSGDSESAYKSLEFRLVDSGYKSVDAVSKGFDGAKLLKIKKETANTFYIMPYLDKDYRLNVREDHFILKQRGNFSGGGTNGLISIEENYNYTCETCQEKFVHPNFVSTILKAKNGPKTYICLDCLQQSEYLFCSGYRAHIPKSLGIEMHTVLRLGGAYSKWWIEDYAFWSDFSKKYVYNRDETQVRMYDGTVWSLSEFDYNGFICKVTKLNCPSTQMDPKRLSVWINAPKSEDSVKAKTPEVSKDKNFTLQTNYYVIPKYTQIPSIFDIPLSDQSRFRAILNETINPISNTTDE